MLLILIKHLSNDDEAPQLLDMVFDGQQTGEMIEALEMARHLHQPEMVAIKVEAKALMDWAEKSTTCEISLF